jgi:hypothetical protein
MLPDFIHRIHSRGIGPAPIGFFGWFAIVWMIVCAIGYVIIISK